MERSSFTIEHFPDRRVIRQAEGGAVYVAERQGMFYVIVDESTLASLLDEDDREGLEFSSVLEFESEAERRAYLLKRYPQAKPADGSWYNGYSPKERDEKFKVLKRLLASGEVPPASGPCMLCGDPETKVEYHSEDYASPYRWDAPAMLCLCRHCHRDKLHKRFWRHSAWHAFIAHVRRGGYARDLKDPGIKKEVERYRKAAEAGTSAALAPLRIYSGRTGKEWFAVRRGSDGSRVPDRSGGSAAGLTGSSGPSPGKPGERKSPKLF